MPVFAQKKVWGLNVQVYSLHVLNEIGGLGDFADLACWQKVRSNLAPILSASIRCIVVSIGAGMGKSL